MTLTIDLPPELERKLRETSAAKGIPAEEFVVGALSESLKHANPVQPLPPRLSQAEGKLLQAINTGLPESTWNRYHELIARRRAETMTPEEQAELIQLTTRVEQMHVARLEKLIELARIRGVKVETLMDELGLRDPGYV
jgi:hypothetical protein